MARTIPSNFVATIPTLSSWNLGSTGAVHTLQFHEVWSMKKYHALKYHKHYLGQMKLLDLARGKCKCVNVNIRQSKQKKKS